MNDGRKESTNMEWETEKTLKVKRLSKNASLPTRATSGSAGLDIKSSEDIIIKARSVSSVKTGICFASPEGCYIRIAPRSGLALKNGIQVGAGVIDADYRGEIKVVLFNHKDSDFRIERGDKIAQIVCEKIEIPVIKEVSEMDSTERGSKGFGSTGDK